MSQRKKGAVLKSLQEIESLFEFGGEIAPFLEELLTFLSDLMPILAKANRSALTTASSAPSASDNIASASMMAEDATHSIMDNAEQITQDLDILIGNIPEGKNAEILGRMAEKLLEINISLQFQDITSQHLAQAMKIVEAIQTRMERLFDALQEIGSKNEMIQAMLDKYVDDADAEIDTEDTIHMDNAISQADIDALFG